MIEYKGLIRRGSRGSNVAELQKTLSSLGYSCGTPDGINGAMTESAIKSFQRDNKLLVDGLFGRQSYDMLNKLLTDKLTIKLAPTKQYEILRPDKQTTIVKIRRDAVDSVDVVLANTKSNLETVGNMQKRTGCDFVINGGLYWVDNKTGKAHSLNLLIDEYKQNNTGTYSRYGLMIYKDGNYKFGHYKWTSDLKDMIGGSPTLIIDGKINIDRGSMSGGLITARHPRSAIGMNDNYFFMVTIDGRRVSQGLYGMTINELANYMLSIGCKYALNNDGGGSVRMMHNGKLLNNALENRLAHNGIGIKLKEV